MNRANGTVRAVPGEQTPSRPVVTLCVLIPGGGAPRYDDGSLAGIVERSIRKLAEGLLGPTSGEKQVRLVAYDPNSQLLENIPNPAAQATHPLGAQRIQAYLRLFREADPSGARRIIILASVSFLLRSRTLPADLLDRCLRFGACCVGRSGGDLYAVAFASGAIEQCSSRAPALLRRITCQCRTSLDGEHDCRSHGHRDRVDAFDTTCSPAMLDIDAASTAPHFDSPSSVNVAVAEVFHHPADRAPVSRDPIRLKHALVAQRDHSATPWLFNELLSEAEYRTGEIYPQSIPPEVHLAISSFCNIECSFCSYSHASARKNRVSPEQLMRLDFLRHARTLRLHSGNGEPTANPELATLISFVEKAYPQISMNFFTNGILLDRQGLIPALVGGHVAWISVSLNAASRQGWLELCGADQFDRVCRNVESLDREKKRRGVKSPVIYGSMVLTRKSVSELPQMPKLCSRLGIDRFTAIPFFSLGYDATDRLNSTDAYHHIGDGYDEIHDATVAEARRYNISLELPSRRDRSVALFGVERRDFFDFADIEVHDGRIRSLLGGFEFPALPNAPCSFLWRQAAIGSTTRSQGSADDTHFLYPCLGPLAALDLAPQTAFRFPDEAGFVDLWRNLVFTRLRRGQTEPGLVEICDACRGCDSRAPENIAPMSDLLKKFGLEIGLGAGHTS